MSPQQRQRLWWFAVAILPFTMCLKYELASQISKSCEICRILGILGLTRALSVSLVPDMSVRVFLVSSQKIKMNFPYHRTLKKIRIILFKNVFKG